MHDPALCPGCQTGHPCRVVTRGHARYWDLYQADPGTWGPILAADARADAGQPVELAPAAPYPVHVPAPALPADVAADNARFALACAAIDACPARSDETPGCRCEAHCSERGRRVPRTECQRCQYERLAP